MSLSLEGKNLWVIRSLPVEMKTIINAKMLFNILLVLPASLICTVVFMIQFRVTIIQSFLYLAIAVITVLLSTVWGMWINVHFPNYDWDNEVEVIKQGMGTAIDIFSSMIGFAVVTVLVFLLSSLIPGELAMLLFGLLLFAITAVLYRSIIR